MKLTKLFNVFFHSEKSGGIGFTMSIFITLLAFDENELIEQSKFAIMLASLAAGIIGYITLKICFKNSNKIAVVH
jgi:Na+:H+ antiporter, NhaA family